MKSLPWIKWNPTKWLSSETRFGMNTSERAIYLDLLFLNYEKGSLPSDLDQLAGMAVVSREEFDRAWPKVSKKFPPRVADPTRLSNEVVEDELHRRAEMAEAGKIGGVASGASRRRRHNEANRSSKPFNIDKETEEGDRERDRDGEKTHSLSRVLSGRETELLNEFLELYPKKTGHVKAKRAYISFITTEALHAELIAGVNRYLGQSSGGGRVGKTGGGLS
jgi:hypothetical protein